MTENGQPPAPVGGYVIGEREFAKRYAAHHAAFEQIMDEAEKTKLLLADARIEIEALRRDNVRLAADREVITNRFLEAVHARSKELQHLRDRDVRLRAKAELLGQAFADYLGELNAPIGEHAGEIASTADSSPPGEARSQSPGGAT